MFEFQDFKIIKIKIHVTEKLSKLLISRLIFIISKVSEYDISRHQNYQNSYSQDYKYIKNQESIKIIGIHFNKIIKIHNFQTKNNNN